MQLAKIIEAAEASITAPMQAYGFNVDLLTLFGCASKGSWAIFVLAGSTEIELAPKRVSCVKVVD